MNANETIDDGCLVLVADDDVTVTVLMEGTLNQLGYRVVTAADGQQAVDAFDRHRPDFVFLDVEMPHITGFEVCRHIRKQDPIGEIPVVMVTGMDDETSINRAYEAGATFFVVKPINWVLIGYMLRYIRRATLTMVALKRAEMDTRAIVEALPDLLLHFDGDGFCTGYQRGSAKHRSALLTNDMVGRCIEQVLGIESREAGLSLIRACLATGSVQTTEFSLQGETGERFCELRISWKDENQVIALLRDITDRRRAEKHIRYLAYYDPLTQLPNRQFLLERLAELLNARDAADWIALLVLDIDNFGKIVETQGHQFTDAILKDFSNNLARAIERPLLRGLVGEGAGRLIRLGGDEFVLVAERVRSQADVENLVREIIAVSGEPWDLQGREISLSSSIGIAVYPLDGDDAVSLLTHASTAMHQAKLDDRGSYRWYDAELTSRAVRRMEMETMLRRAIDEGQFELHYQPKVSAVDRRIVGFEALIRWQHPEQGYIPPPEFIPIAEDNGFIHRLGMWVVQRACRDLLHWYRRWGEDTPSLSINVSARQLHQGAFVNDVLQLIADAGAPARMFEFELTESIFIHSAEENISVFERLRDAGIELSIDDFGTGYSSMNYLRRFPVQTLKIDKSFIDDILESRDAVMIVRAMIAMAQALNLQTIAEGIEDERQARMLRDFGCGGFQGFHFFRPMPREQIDALLAERLTPRRV